MTGTTVSDRIARDAAAALRELYPIGSTVQTKLLHVSRSGTLRSFAVLAPMPDGMIRDVSGLVADATGAKIHTPTGGVTMVGAGMDMGFALAYNIARVLYRDGFPCTGARYGTEADAFTPAAPGCPSNDHANDTRPDYGYDRIHSDAGYALAHRHI